MLRYWEISFFLAEVPKQRSSLVDLPLCNVNIVTLSAQGVQWEILPDLNPWSMGHKYRPSFAKQKAWPKNMDTNDYSVHFYTHD